MTIRNEFIIIVVLGLILLGLIAAGVQELPPPLPTLRLLLGLFFVLFAPGYTLQASLFPCSDDLGDPERLALSFGLSIAIVPPIALILDNLPWGLRLWPIVAAEGLFIIICSLIAWMRRRWLSEGDRFVLVVAVDVKEWWVVQDRTNRILYGILVGALLIAVVSVIIIVVLPKSGEHFTEFYILGPEGLAENYPREVVVGQTVAVTVGIANREGVQADYQVFIVSEDLLIGYSEPVYLKPGETGEQLVSFTPVVAGDDVEVTFLLSREGVEGTYRSLRLWLKVTE
ncbi:MAG: DUF1616 domain-containing protein [Chloroflexi bacterium]|nr:DUF1616 domain-containing protein [Chloroflexota bacterium]